jgi:TatD DNase family protein
VGETGFDNYHRHAEPADQRRVFAAQLALGERLGKPVVVHSRDADEETAAALARSSAATTSPSPGT